VTDEPTICVVEDDAAMRDALRMLLLSQDFNVCCYATAEDFLAEMDPSLACCVLTDVRLPGMDGFALHRHLVSLGTDPIVVMITGHGDIPMAVSALKEGVADFVEKPFDPAVLLDSLRGAMRRALVSQQRRAAAADLRSRMMALTSREDEILSMLIEGHPNKVIAARLGISVRTIEHHRAHIMEKARARSLSHLIRIALAMSD
jgi:two-component system, LuxR family, response regulator FixJ